MSTGVAISIDSHPLPYGWDDGSRYTKRELQSLRNNICDYLLGTTNGRIEIPVDTLNKLVEKNHAIWFKEFEAKIYKSGIPHDMFNATNDLAMMDKATDYYYRHSLYLNNAVIAPINGAIELQPEIKKELDNYKTQLDKVKAIHDELYDYLTRLIDLIKTFHQAKVLLPSQLHKFLPRANSERITSKKREQLLEIFPVEDFNNLVKKLLTIKLLEGNTG